MRFRIAVLAALSATVLAGCANGAAPVYSGDMGLSSSAVAPSPTVIDPAAPTDIPTPAPTGQPGESGPQLSDLQKRNFTVNLDAELTVALGSKEADKVVERMGANSLTTALVFCDVARGAGYDEAARFLVEDAYAPDYYADAVIAAATADNGICPDVKPASDKKKRS